jgi:hypothetical protein
MTSAAAPYRDPSVLYQDVWDWDVIVYPDGSIRVLCWTNGCLYGEYGHIGRECDCAERSRMSSPVVDEYKRPLKEAPYYPWAGTARHLLSVTEGSELTVMSGKSYRLNGPRVSHEGFHGASIWKVYEEKVEEEPLSLWQRTLDWLW